MATRVGPTLTLVASCERCRWLSRDMTVWRCAHPLIAGTRKPAIGGSTLEPATPSGCPEMPGARLAMAREIVAGAEAMREEAARRWDEAIEAAESAREAQKESE